MKNKLQDYTEIEFFELLQNLYDDKLSTEEMEEMIEFLDKTEYPKGSMLLINPSSLGIEDEASAIVEELRRWHGVNGLKCFKGD